MLLCLLAALAAAQTDPAALSAQARQAMEQRRFAEAAAIYEQLNASIPNNPGLQLNLGLARFSEGNYRAAKPAFESAVKLNPSLAPAWLLLGLTERKLGDAARAVAPLEKAIAAQPANPIARLELADAYLSLERHREAAHHFRKFTELAPNDATGWFGLGSAAEHAAQDAYAELDRIAPGSPFRHALYARLRANAFQYRSAYHAYRKALSAKPDLPGLHTAIARIYEAEQKPEWAATERRREPPCRTPAIACDVLAGRHWAATGSPLKTPEATYWRAIAYLQIAAAAYAKLQSLPASAESHWRNALVLRDQARYPDAAAQFRLALEKKPNLPQLKREYARTLWLGRDYEAAAPVLEQLLKEDGESPERCYQLGDTLLNLDRTNEALNLLETARKLDPKTPGLTGALGTALVRAGKPAEAIPLLEQSLASDEDGRLHFQLSRAYQLTNHPEKSAAILEQRERLLADQEKQKTAEAITAPDAHD